MLSISFFQYCPVFNQVQNNFDNITQLLESNRTQIITSDIMIFPEYFLSGSIDLNHFEDYKAQIIDLEIRLCQLSEQYPSTTFVFGGVILPFGDKFANTSLAILNGKILVKYNKKALIYNENYTCTATNDYPIFEVIPKNTNQKSPYKRVPATTGEGTIKIGLAICWDTILPEVFRHYTNRVDLVIIPAFWGIGGNALQSQYSHSLEKTYYRQLLTTRGYENAFTTIFINSVGAYQSPSYSDRMMGGSVAIMPPLGEIFFTNLKDPDKIHTLELDFKHLQKYRGFYATGQDYEYYKSTGRF